VVCNHNGEDRAVVPFGSERVLRLRVHADADGMARFAYAGPVGDFIPLGSPFRMEFTVKTFLGNRVGFFCFQDGNESGWADFDGMDLEVPRPDNRHDAGGWIAFADYDSERGTDTHRLEEKRPAQVLADLQAGDWVLFHRVQVPAEARSVEIRGGAFVDGVTLEVHHEKPDGPILAVVPMPRDPGTQPWKPVLAVHRASLDCGAGQHRLCFVIRGSGHSLAWLDAFRVLPTI
jgi:hypothetical protein